MDRQEFVQFVRTNAGLLERVNEVFECVQRDRDLCAACTIEDLELDDEAFTVRYTEHVMGGHIEGEVTLPSALLYRDDWQGYYEAIRSEIATQR